MQLRTLSIQDTADLFVLSSFAIAQPIFDLITKNPGFLAARRSEPAEIGWVVVSLSLGVPLILLLFLYVAGFLGKRVRLGVYFSIFVLLLSLIVLPASKKITPLPGWACCLLSLLIGAAGAFWYGKYRNQRLSLRFLFPAVLLFPVLFLSHAPVRKQVFGTDKRGATVSVPIGQPVPIVMVIFDEFPVSSLMDEREEIDSKYFPNFSMFSKDAIWFRNASAVTDGTLNSVPSILCGLYPQPGLGLLPNARDYPQTLFTLLAATYRFHVQENNTRLCPESLCQEKQKAPAFQRVQGWAQDLGILYLYVVLPREMTSWLPDISSSWGDFAPLGKPTAGAKLGIAEYGELNKWIHRPGQFTQFVNSIVPSAKPTLHFLHILLPHAPWEFLPSGKKYSMEPEIRGLVDNSNKHWDPFLWGGDRWAVAEAYQRHMLQVCLVDRLFGDLIDRLRSTDLYDQSLIIVVADHGCSFRINDSRRRPTPSNYPDILNVPFFLKLPYRNEGRIDDSNVETIDALPTIAEILKVRLPWKVDGISVLSPLPVRRNTKTFITEQGERRSFPATLDGRVEAIRYKFELFGRGSQVADLFKMGPHQELLGRNAEEVGPIEDSKSDLELDNPGYLSNYDSQASVTLTHVTGRIRRSSSEVIPQPLDLALAINGTIRAITKTYWSGREERFSAITPDWAYREGRNDVTGYAILRSKEGIRLARFHRLNGIPPYRWGDLIRLDRSGNSSLYLGDGWCHYSEGDFTWTDGKRASLGIDHDPVQGTVLLRVKLMPYWVRKSVEHQRIRILVNQRPVGEWMIDKPGIQEKNLVLPGEYFSRSARCMITFELPDAVSPASLGLGPDIRELGLAVYWISLAPEQLS